jgi:hypothetical protein
VVGFHKGYGVFETFALLNHHQRNDMDALNKLGSQVVREIPKDV